MKKVSIIITNFNRKEFLSRSIRSCLEQSLSRNINTEIIVVDDGSTDDSMKLLEMFKDSVKIIKLKKNRGVAYASNVGIKKSSGDFVLRLDADDFLNKYAIQFLSEVLINNKNLDFVYCDHFRADEMGFKEELIKLDNFEVLFEHGAGVMFKRRVFNKIGFYDESLKNCEDYDFLIRVTRKFKGFYLPIPLYRYYIHGANISLKKDREKIKKKVRKRYGI